jgi:transketolase
MSNKNLANALRFLSIDAVETSNSGHPGMPMGMADFTSVLFNEFLKFNPQDANWHDRDRFILSAGHGSMLLYSALFLSGYPDICLDDLKKFRQLHSKCAGHPEYGEISGVETTTGPLGQGIANAVGMALSEKILKARFGEKIYNHKIYAIAGDGCLMEGISQEALSLAGHLKLNNLILIWDNNAISIDGKTSIATSEDMIMRFTALGFNTISIDGHNFDEIRQALTLANQSDRPFLIDCKTTIGFGSPSKAGSEKCHGSPLGSEEIKKVRDNLNWQYPPFVIPDEILNQWRNNSKKSQEIYKKSLENLNNLNSDHKKLFEDLKNKKLIETAITKLEEYKSQITQTKPTLASRKSSQLTLEILTKELPNLIGGSADLTESVLTKTSSTISISSSNFLGSYIHYGVREHAMGAIMNGLALHGNFIPYGGTFLVFSDYLKPALRLSALMKQQVIYVFTHDSIGLGEDGPTHQPIEHLASLRSIPNVLVHRPADIEETIACYQMALEAKNSPSAIILSRQNLNFLEKHSQNYNRGAYIIADFDKNKKFDLVIMATGSEVEIAINVKKILQDKNINSRVISAPCLEIFNQQSKEYQQQILAKNSSDKISYCAIEAGVKNGWHEYIGADGIFFGMNSFGASAKATDLYQHFNLTAEKIAENLMKNIFK